MPHAAARRPRRIQVGFLALGLYLLAMVACSGLVSRQGWDPAHGPVVPHDTFPSDCKLCHTGEDWRTIRSDFAFDHEQATGVALEGAHAQASCLMCHNDRGPVQQYATQGCAGCHGDPHQGRLGRGCRDCHDERTWRPSGPIAAHDRTRFPLVGAHVVAACWRCHPGAQVGNFAGASSECAHCHAADLARATVPDHQALGFVDDCQRCHRPTDWRPAQFDHPASFPLTRGHANRGCSECHVGGTFAGLSTACASCHLDDYQAASNPNHQAGGFSTSCQDCHTTAGWRPSTFNHPASFPLTLGHAGRACNQCHTNGVFTGLSTDCSSCHLTAYQATTNPNHAASGYPTSCQDCHTTASWRGTSFAHPFTFNSPHRVGCTECHRTPGNVREYSCTHCHDHGQTTMQDKHNNVSGYAWVSTACYGCHPQLRH